MGLSLALIGAGCDSETVADPDSGPPPADTGVGDPDAGGPPDAGDMRDAGSEPDAGAGGEDAGAPSICTTPGTVTIAETCPDFTPCSAGSVVGEWCYSSICIREDELIPPPMGGFTCDAAFSDVTGTVTGSVVFTDSRVTRDVTTMVAGTVTITGQCAGFGCGSVERGIQDELGDDGTVDCDAPPGMAGTCVCNITFTSEIFATDDYSVAGTTITVGARTYDYCVDGTDFSFRDSTGDEQTEPGIQSLTPSTAG